MIAPGVKADVILWKAASWDMTPLRDPVKNIVYNVTAEDIDRVYVGGRLVVRNGRMFAPTKARSWPRSRAAASACGRA